MKFTVICFHCAINMSAAEIHHELCVAVYGQNAIGGGALKKWCRMFKDWLTNVHVEEQIVLLAICSEW
jgi:hypothetical protein